MTRGRGEGSQALTGWELAAPGLGLVHRHGAGDLEEASQAHTWVVAISECPWSGPHRSWGAQHSLMHFGAYFAPELSCSSLPVTHGFTCLCFLAVGKSGCLMVIKVWSHENLKVFLQP